MAYAPVGQTTTGISKDAYTSYSASGPTPTCVSPEEKRQADIDCQYQSVKGLGATYPSGSKFAGMDPCQVKQLPLCLNYKPMSFVQPWVGQQTATVQPNLQDATTVQKTAAYSPPPTLLDATAMPMQPQTAATAPPPPRPPPNEKQHRRQLAVVGILAALVVGGVGYIVYRSTKKKG